MVVGVALAVTVTPGAASAHASLVSSTPKEGGTVKKPLREVTLRFNEDIQAKFATVAVTDADGEKISAGDPEVHGAVVTQPVRAVREPGKYTVGYRVVSADGHPVSGSYSFTVAAGAVAPTAATSRSAQPPRTLEATATTKASRQSPEERSFLERHAAHLLIGAVIVLAGAAVIVWERRRRHE